MHTQLALVYLLINFFNRLWNSMDQILQLTRSNGLLYIYFQPILLHVAIHQVDQIQWKISYSQLNLTDTRVVCLFVSSTPKSLSY